MKEKLRDVLEITALFGMAALLIAIGLQFAGEAVLGRQLVVWVSSIFMIGFVIAAQRLRGLTLKEFGLRPVRFSLKGSFSLIGKALLALALAAGGFILGSVLMVNITGVPESADMSSYTFLSGNLGMFLLSLAGVFVGASFGEELVYRGFLMSRFGSLFGGTGRPWLWAAVFSSVMFGFAHYDWGWMGIVQTTFMGAGLAFAWLKFGRNLWVVILAHAVMDFLLFLQLYLA